MAKIFVEKIKIQRKAPKKLLYLSHYELVFVLDIYFVGL